MATISLRGNAKREGEPRRSEPKVLLLGPPGAGQSRLARRLTTILPDMTLAEALDTTRIPRVAGLTGRRPAVVTTRPFRAPHQPMADVGLIGGGQVPMPGELSGDHRGVRFLDGTPGVQAARPGSAATAAEKGRVIIGRTSLFLTLPFYHSLISTMNYRPEG